MRGKNYSFDEKSDDNNEFHIIKHLNVGNMFQYQKDNELYNFNKLCLIKIENAAVLLTYLGEKKYIDLLEKTILKVYRFMKHKGYNGVLSITL